MKLLATELAAKRIDPADYEMIRRNMNGRQGYPQIPGVWIIQQRPDGGKDTIQAGI